MATTTQPDHVLLSIAYGLLYRPPQRLKSVSREQYQSFRRRKPCARAETQPYLAAPRPFSGRVQLWHKCPEIHDPCVVASQPGLGAIQAG